jgi:hypothetical protein
MATCELSISYITCLLVLKYTVPDKLEIFYCLNIEALDVGGGYTSGLNDRLPLIIL